MDCKAFTEGRCRSCALIESPYDQQLHDKQSHANALLAPLGLESWHPPVKSQESGFRNKAKMVVGGTVETPTLGILDDQQQGVDLQDCPLYPPVIQNCFVPLARFISLARLTPYDVPTRRGELKYLLLTAAEHSGKVMLRFVLRSTEALSRIRKHLPTLQAELPCLCVISVNIQPDHKATLEGEREILLSDHPTLTMQINHVPIHLHPGSFFQTNTQVAAALYRQVAQWVEAANPTTLWDLYCGAGGFALHCAQPQRQVTGVEISAAAIASACQSRDELGLSQVDFHVGDATRYAAGTQAWPDCLVVNPPRRGIGNELCRLIRDSKARTVMYSSCNAVSLARDIKELHEFRPHKARLFDMFPHTAHYEVACWLERIG